MKYYIGIDLGGTNIVAGVVDEQFQLLAKASDKTRVGRPAQEIAQTMAQTAQDAAKAAGIGMDQVESVGIGSPGIVDSEKKEVLFASNLYFENVPIGQMVEDLLHVPVFIANDADAAAYGEFMAGAGRMEDGRHISNMLAITLGTGVGGGILTGGRLLEGARGLGGELGHFRLHALDGVACTCGAIGCYERYAATTALVRDAQRMGLDAPDGRTIFEAAAAGDARTQAVLNHWINEIAQGLAGLVHIFNPQLILIGGGVSAQQALLIDPLAEKVRASIMPAFAEGLELKAAALQNDAGLVGAVYYFRNNSIDLHL